MVTTSSIRLLLDINCHVGAIGASRGFWALIIQEKVVCLVDIPDLASDLQDSPHVAHVIAHAKVQTRPDRESVFIVFREPFAIALASHVDTHAADRIVIRGVDTVHLEDERLVDWLGAFVVFEDQEARTCLEDVLA